MRMAVLGESGAGGGVLRVLVCVSVCVSVCCFNLDSRFAVIKHSQTPGSLFGLSVALHQKISGGKTSYLLLVGAPKEKAEVKLSANQTGDMFSCPISADSNDCKRANLITSETQDTDGIVDGMWLGVSVASQPQPGGRVMACGHRYIRNRDRGNTLQMIGKCYIRSNDLSYNEDDYDWQYRYEVCSPEGDQSQEGLCNMGISATFTQTERIVGAPGCYNWQGNTFVVYVEPGVQYDTKKSKFKDMSKGYTYIGYSVGKEQGILSKTEDTVVSGAPRDDSKGAVILAKKEPNLELRTLFTLKGEQVGSYFGNSIAIVDLNNDGWKELIVGAPFYFQRREEKGGAVYIFMNENGSFQEKTSPFFTGPKQSGFGMAVAAIGDVNQDGFQDFAVGAPYHDSGSVYVWMGSKNPKDPASAKPSQVIKGKDITNGGFRTFGYSISGGLDVDGNKYPDVVVGSLDDRVALLRARPVIHLQKSFTVTPPVIDPDDCNSCIEVKVCFSYTISTGDPTFNKDITVNYTVVADLLQRSTRSRVQFVKNGKDLYNGFLTMPKTDCETLILKLLIPIQNKVAPLSFSLNVSLSEPSPGPQQELQNLDSFPVISQSEALTDTAEVHFKKSCGLDNTCESNLQMNAMFYSNQQLLLVQDDHQVLLYNSTVKKLALLVNVWNTPSEGRLAEDAYNTELNITIPPLLQYSRVSESSVQCNVVKESEVLCRLGDPFKGGNKIGFYVEFETTGITLDIREISVVLQLSTLSSQPELPHLNKLLMVDYTLQTIFNVSQVQQVEFSGAVVGESALKSTADIGSPVDFTFKVSLTGKPLGSLGFLQVHFDWPLELDNGKWLLYVAEIQTLGTSSSTCVPDGDIVNPLKLTVSERVRRKRSDEESSVVRAEAQASLQGAHARNVQLRCEYGVKCRTFKCPLHNMNNSATLRVRARLWNSTMLEDYKDSQIRIIGQATLELVTDKPAIRMDNSTNKLEFHVDVTPAGQKEAQYEAPLWIIIVSVLAGVLLLTLIILLLWKCGFFRRANTRELYEAKAQKAEMKVQPSETDRLTEDE